jgi:hypothetical protein
LATGVMFGDGGGGGACMSGGPPLLGWLLQPAAARVTSAASVDERRMGRLYHGHAGCSPSGVEGGMSENEGENENEGEGSKSADRAYRRDVREFLDENDPAKLGRKAAEDIEKDPEAYKKAEREGKERSAGDLPSDKDLI